MTTRSGAIYNRAVTNSAVTTPVDATLTEKRNANILPTNLKECEISRSAYSLRDCSTSFSKEYIREYCGDSDNDSTSTYDSEDEYKEVQSYTENRFHSIAPKYEVHIDFDEASIAWRANKRRVGESWVYKTPKNERPKVNKRPTANKRPKVHVTAKSTMVTRSSNRRR